MNIDKSKPILVTGGSGYIASWIVKYLLEDGYTVRATVRNKSKEEKYQHLLDITTTGKLEIFEADLLKDGAFDKAVEGCEIVMHTASPFLLDIKDPQKELVDPALKGTRNVLSAASKSSSIKRVVLTSSVVSIYGDAKECKQTDNNRFDESVWNTTSSLKHQPYSFSKVLAEKEAWKIADAQSNWDMVVINPGFVLGPSLTKYSASESIKLMKDLLKGKLMFGVPDLCFAYVDVRDVATAHIMAAFTPEAKGRHITVESSGPMLNMANAIRSEYGKKSRLPKGKVPKWLLMIIGPTQGLSRQYIKDNVGYEINFDNSKIKEELGMKFRPFNETVLDHANQLSSSGLV